MFPLVGTYCFVNVGISVCLSVCLSVDQMVSPDYPEIYLSQSCHILMLTSHREDLTTMVLCLLCQSYGINYVTQYLKKLLILKPSRIFFINQATSCKSTHLNNINFLLQTPFVAIKNAF